MNSEIVEKIESLLNEITDGYVLKTMSYQPLGAEKAITVLTLAQSENDSLLASESIQRAAGMDGNPFRQASNDYIETMFGDMKELEI